MSAVRTKERNYAADYYSHHPIFGFGFGGYRMGPGLGYYGGGGLSLILTIVLILLLLRSFELLQRNAHLPLIDALCGL